MSDTLFPTGHHLLLPLEWKDSPDVDGPYWLKTKTMNCPVEVWSGPEHRYIGGAGWTSNLSLRFTSGNTKWLYLGEIERAAKEVER